MILLSVLLAAITVHTAVSRRLSDISNELTPGAIGNRYYRENPEWVKIFSAPQDTVAQKYGAPVELTCQAMGSPPPTIQWYKRNTKLTENEPDYEVQSEGLAKVTSRLVINYLLPRHEDLYRCVAVSGGEEATAVSKLIVINTEGNRELNFTQLLQNKILGAYHRPRASYWATTYMDVIGNNVYLPCRTVGNPKPELVWLDPMDRKVSRDERDRVHVMANGDLAIREMQWSDMGNYICSVSNVVGEDQVETFLYPMKRSDK
ncbi:neural/ectodermal development factor IMP-L2 isoform X3 [Aethina tumida]|uniref:neural/ectodermal development factor IMP-L2 isoform X1 n=1 Tax=Aethina tumida TaxID=116153 RepID=UPI00096B298E|nr:neural/ectodermal development factor IMP-L2 isoform X1 [Aethina tumida]XP_049824841.1 neural/ectodermal development factor IMP-L2 isoform X2 [Aethina tumida]XP_049824842.1 neural/ectodermal development factor IMP-L2 isoform X3 [Aethina tumida]